MQGIVSSAQKQNCFIVLAVQDDEFPLASIAHSHPRSRIYRNVPGRIAPHCELSSSTLDLWQGESTKDLPLARRIQTTARRHFVPNDTIQASHD